MLALASPTRTFYKFVRARISSRAMTIRSGKGRGNKEAAPPSVPNVVVAHYSGQVDGSPSMSVSSGDNPRTSVSASPSSYAVYGGNASFVRLRQRVADTEPERKKDGSPFLTDTCPAIEGITTRSQIIEGIPWQELQALNVAEWRCWKFIQNWRLLAHEAPRL